jgi:hypothetical protein
MRGNDGGARAGKRRASCSKHLVEIRRAERFARILVTIGSKDQPRAVFQPVAMAIFVMTAGWIGAKGAITPDTLRPGRRETSPASVWRCQRVS